MVRISVYPPLSRMNRGKMHMAFRPDRMKQRRMEKGLTQRELAKLMETNQQTINLYEHGRTPAPDMLVKLADALDTNMEWLLDRLNYAERLTKRHIEVWGAFEDGDPERLRDLLRQHLREKGVGKLPIARR